MRITPALVVLILSARAAAPSQAQVDTRTAVAEISAEAAEAILGIVHYTRWPEPAAPLRVCLIGKFDDAAAESLARRLGEAATGQQGPPLVNRRAETAGLVDCHVAYTASAAPAIWRPLLSQLGGRPVLTIGHGEEFCSFGGMFCLEPGNAGLRIRANLDAISRSGLRVNPQLLRFTQRGNGQPTAPRTGEPR